MYGSQLWGCAANSNIEVIQRFQNTVLRCIVDASWFLKNSNIHKDLGILFLKDEIKRLAKKHEDRLLDHTNVEELQLLVTNDLTRRLKRRKPFELV